MKPLRLSTHLLLGLASALGILTCAIASYAAAQSFAAQTSATPTLAEQYLLAAANQERAALGLTPLHRDPRLEGAALQHARQMAAHRSISHQFPGEPELSTRGADAGVPFSVISENVGQAPSAIQIHDMWMHSNGHRSNLLDPAIDAVGVSVIARGGELYAVEDFARTVRSLSLGQQESAIAALIAQPDARSPTIALDLSPDTTSAARRTCSMSTGYAGPRTPSFVMRFTSDSLTRLPDPLKSRLASGSYRQAAVGACESNSKGPFTSYNIVVLLYP